MRGAAAILNSAQELEKEKKQQVLSFDISDCVNVHVNVWWEETWRVNYAQDKTPFFLQLFQRVVGLLACEQLRGAAAI